MCIRDRKVIGKACSNLDAILVAEAVPEVRSNMSCTFLITVEL